MFRSMCVLFGIAALMLSAGSAAAVELEYGWQRPHRVMPPDVKAPDDPTYSKECGACHFAYQPGLLPARSWKKIMASLDKHFGENAELPKEDNLALTQYLVENAADRSKYRRSIKMNRSIRSGDTPLRITEVPYFVREHRELGSRYVKNNPKVKSLSNCQACHTQIAKGSFSEREIRIPGYGRWED